jgi:uncharacterized membrane protein YkgB
MNHSRIAKHFDHYVIDRLRQIELPLARLALFSVFFWFGFLKLVDASPANPLVADLLHETLPFVSFQDFIIVLGVWEIAIAFAFLLPKMERFAIALLLPHMVTTVLPLFLLAPMTWQAPFVPTLEGQYIIKNLVIIALAISIAARIHPWERSRKK